MPALLRGQNRRTETTPLDLLRRNIERITMSVNAKWGIYTKCLERDENKRQGTGIIRSLNEGVALTIHDLLTLMIIVSDNTATDLLFEKVGGTWFDALHAAGARRSFTAKPNIRSGCPRRKILANFWNG